MASKSRPSQRKPELMAPAGNWTCLRAALRAGADALYFGVSGFNMRANYRNFLPREMQRIAAECHGAGARAYLALNTIIYENELPKVGRILQTAKEAGIDAVICWDLAVVQKAAAIQLPVFLSTQMSVSNSESLALFYRTFGIRRFVLARECSLEQIQAMRRRLKKLLGAEADCIEIEVFGHGAMCVSVSGRCFLSQDRFGKSGNRGECIQPCRREYKITDVEDEISFRLGNNYLLSPEDLCTMPFLDQLLASGIASLKIEGRARTPEYVSTVTSAYRRAIDFYFENKGRRGFKAAFEALKTELTATLDTAYHRGLSSGFFMGKPVDQWTTGRGSRAKQSKRLVGEVVNYYRKAGAAEIQVRNAGFALGDELLIQGPTTGLVRLTVASIQIEHAARQCAERGEHVALSVPEQVRPRDRVFVVTQRES
ncbi:MAG: U32 family peptidase [Verrucomicrobia bacterium]|nr:U32 family peptidase [Verrucomicrobiota bacterium]